MAKDEKYNQSNLPKAEEIFSNPNELEEALKDLETYEDYTNTDNLYQSTDGDRLIVEKHEPYEDAKKAKIDKSAKFLNEKELRDAGRDVYDKKNFNKGLLDDPKEIEDLLESEEAFSKNLKIED